MSGPFLSVVIPAYNEERCIERTIDDVCRELDGLGQPWELLVVDDGSTDGTAAIAAARQSVDGRVRLLSCPHRGKGAAVRDGMLAASGAWRFLADADLSMPIGELRKFLSGQDGPRADILIGSREAIGAERVGEPWQRHLVGRLFNRMAKWLAVPGIEDTQCGFKLFSAAAAETVFPMQRLDGFGFDVEVLFLARRAGIRIAEVPITWVYRNRSTVTALSGMAGFVDLFRIRWHALRGRYPMVRQ